MSQENEYTLQDISGRLRLLLFPKEIINTESVRKDIEIMAKAIHRLPNDYKKAALGGGVLYILVNKQVLGLYQSLTHVPATDKAATPHKINLIILNFSVDLTEEEKMGIVAHEITHYILKLSAQKDGLNPEDFERQVGTLIAQFGFTPYKRSYDVYKEDENVIRVYNHSEEQLRKNGVFSWPIWEKGISKFEWRYEQTEECYLLEGGVEVKTKEGDFVYFGKGDFVVFPKGLSCTWNIRKPVKKHYNFKS